MHGSSSIRAPLAIGPAVPSGLAWRLVPWRALRRGALVAVLALASTVGWLRLGELEAGAAALTPGGDGTAAAPAPALEPPPPVAPARQPVPALTAEAVLPVPDPAPALEEHSDPEPPSGEASYYAAKFEGRTTASGERYRGAALTAAHRTLPFGTEVRVTNLVNGRSVVVRINDRGPFHRRRVIDLSRAAAERLGMVQRGRAPVEVEVVAAAAD
jgi:rare lipoprotein A